MPFSRFMEVSLYDPVDGFYSQGGQAGRRSGDFITSVETGPLFGAVIASHLDTTWHAVGRPSDFRVAEAGAGVGTLYRTVYAANPDCLEALTWTLVEQSGHLRAQHELLPGEAWASRSDLPTEHQHLTLANELLDNLPFDIAESVAGGWARVNVVIDSAAASGMAFEPGPVDPALDYLSALVPDAAVGSQVPIMSAAQTWVSAARSQSHGLLLFDYAADSNELAKRGRDGWLRTYRSQQRGSDPLIDPGEWDVTADVAWDQLGRDLVVSTQAEWLERAGIAERVRIARETWKERAHIGDLKAMVARSAIGEAEALTAADGLGGFMVLEWSGISRTEPGPTPQS